MDEIYRVLILGLRDYLRKNEFREVLVGISGGVDSALVAALAVYALGGRATCTGYSCLPVIPLLSLGNALWSCGTF